MIDPPEFPLLFLQNSLQDGSLRCDRVSLDF